VRVQAQDWRTYRDRVAASAPAAEGAGARAAAGKIGTTVEEKAPAVAPGRDQLKVSPQAGTGKAAGAAPLQEEGGSRDKALKEAQNRINELEKTLRDLQKAIELKGQTGAQLQAQAEAARGAAPEAPKATVPPAPAVIAPAPAPAVPPPPKAAEPPKAMEAAPSKAPEAPKVSEAPKVADATKAAPKSDIAKLQPKPEPSFF